MASDRDTPNPASQLSLFSAGSPLAVDHDAALELAAALTKFLDSCRKYADVVGQQPSQDKLRQMWTEQRRLSHALLRRDRLTALFGFEPRVGPSPVLTQAEDGAVTLYAKCPGLTAQLLSCQVDALIPGRKPSADCPRLRKIAASAEGWPGLPPDCWSESRLVHSVQDLGEVWQRNTKITRREGKPVAGQVSPNKGYVFAVEESRPSARITVYAEKPHLVEIEFVELFGLSEVRWVNEKLIFMRPWWGRIAATDLIFDVEREKFIYAESLTDGFLAHQQYLESCPLRRCTCVKRK